MALTRTVRPRVADLILVSLAPCIFLAAVAMGLAQADGMLTYLPVGAAGAVVLYGEGRAARLSHHLREEPLTGLEALAGERLLRSLGDGWGGARPWLRLRRAALVAAAASAGLQALSGW